MPELVRVKDPVSGHEFTAWDTHAESAGLAVLKDRPAVDDFGREVPPKYRVTKDGQPVVKGS